MNTVPGEVPQVWGKVPPRNRNFTGREDLLHQLRESIGGGHEPGQSGVTVLHALHGLGGVGKTQLAVEYAHRFHTDYDLVWWIPADQPILVPAALAALAPLLDVPGATNTGITEAANAVLDALRRGKPYHRWLIIFDNADLPEDLNELLPRGPGDVLITSRNHRWEGVVDAVAVDVFPREESVQFLNKRLKGLLTTAEADLLADAVGDLPLALEQAAALQVETGMSVEEYLRLLLHHTSQLLREGKPTEYPLSLTATWTIAVEQLEGHMPDAVELLRYCAFLGPEPIPRDLFSRSLGAVKSKISGLLSDPIQLSRVIAELGRYALVRLDPSSRTLEVHRLIQALIRNDLPSTEQDRIRTDVQLMLAASAPGTPFDQAAWKRYAELVVHVRPVRVAQSEEASVRAFAVDVVRYLFASGDSRFARVLTEEFLESWEEPGVTDLLVFTARRQLGNALRDLGEFERAFEYNQETLERLRRIVEPDHEAMLELANSIGADLRTRGDFAAAREHDVDLLERHQRAFGPEDPRTLRVMHNLALDYALTSDYPTSKALHNDTLRLQMASESGVTPANILGSFNGLARASRLCGEYKDAVDLGRDAQAQGTNELGSDHPGVLRVAKDLAIALRQSGEAEEALALAEFVAQSCLRSFGPDHPDTLCALMAHANILRTAGRPEEAIVVAVDALARYPKIFGADHPFTHGCAGNVALLRRVLGEPEAALRLNQVALDGLSARLGSDHFFSLATTVNLASDHAALGDHSAAIFWGTEARAALTTLLGPLHPMTLACSANLSADLEAAGRAEEGMALFAETMIGYERVLAHDHSDAEVARQRRHLDCDFDPPPI